jgi:cation-transporting P-type ATPase 13A2
LYGGTTVLQTIKSRRDAEMTEFGFMNVSIDERLKCKTTGLVVRVGFQTLKGGLIKDIMFSDNVHFDFITESYYVVGIMCLIALVGFCSTIPSFIKHHYTLEATVLRFLDLVTTAVPPALPAVLTSGIIYSI